MAYGSFISLEICFEQSEQLVPNIQSPTDKFSGRHLEHYTTLRPAYQEINFRHQSPSHPHTSPYPFKM